MPGTNKLVGIDKIEYEVEEILKGNGKKGKVPDLWDGEAAGRIVSILKPGGLRLTLSPQISQIDVDY